MAISVRMYNVGFGDAFLLSYPDGGKRRRILFDCGSIEAAEGQSMGDVVGNIVRDAEDADGVARIDVVVCTHRHKDHVSGFGNAAWAKVEVQEVWMPWTEDPANPEARRIRDIQSRLALALDAGLAAALAAAPGRAPELARPRAIVENALALSNDKAMKTLHSGFQGRALRRFLPLEDEARRTFTTPALPGVKVHVMGPSRKRDVIRDMDPPAGKSYLRLNPTAVAPGGKPTPPFPREPQLQTYNGFGTFSPQDQDAIRDESALSDLAVAVALDKAVNGTSLMLLLEIDGERLLFPGDAQWGTWQAAMADPEWRELMTHVSFYKVGHHGSHNATPKDFVETLVSENLQAMVSTLRRNQWPDIPKAELLTALEGRKAKIARSDEASEVEKMKIFEVRPGVIEATIG